MSNISNLQPHREVKIRVNAWIDSGVAPLVAALNEFSGVQTLGSCEKGSEGFAYVYFTHREGKNHLLQLVSTLAAELGARIQSCCDVRFRVEWFTGTEPPMAEMIVQPSLVEKVSAELVELSHQSGGDHPEGRSEMDIDNAIVSITALVKAVTDDLSAAVAEERESEMDKDNAIVAITALVKAVTDNLSAAVAEERDVKNASGV